MTAILNSARESALPPKSAFWWYGTFVARTHISWWCTRDVRWSVAKLPPGTRGTKKENERSESVHSLATSEISRSQLWQWLRFGAKLDDGRAITFELYEALLKEELAKIRVEYGSAVYDEGHFGPATDLFMRMVKSEQFDEFLSLPAYELLP